MDTKEKLVELLVDAFCASDDNYGIPNTGQVADHLIAHGVTVQKWVSVKERLPERTVPPRDVLVLHDLNCGMFVDRAWYSYDAKKWRGSMGMNLRVTHWMPLPPPPEIKKEDL